MSHNNQPPVLYSLEYSPSQDAYHIEETLACARKNLRMHLRGNPSDWSALFVGTEGECRAIHRTLTARRGATSNQLKTVAA